MGKKILSDNGKTLLSYNVPDGAYLFFARVSADPPSSPFTYSAPRSGIISRLNFKGLGGDTMTLHEVSLDSTVGEVFHQLGAEMAIETTGLRGIYGGRQLESDKTLRGYNIGDNTDIHFVARVRGGVGV